MEYSVIGISQGGNRKKEEKSKTLPWTVFVCYKAFRDLDAFSSMWHLRAALCINTCSFEV